MSQEKRIAVVSQPAGQLCPRWYHRRLAASSKKKRSLSPGRRQTSYFKCLV